MSSTARSAAASLCGASTIWKPPIWIPRSAATCLILAAGPTRIGAMIPSSAASIGPRSELSSHGCTTTVNAGGTVLALAIRRSYFDSGGWDAGPIAFRVPISLSRSLGMQAPLKLELGRLGGRRSRRAGRTTHNGQPVLFSEQAADALQALAIVGREFTGRAENVLD